MIALRTGKEVRNTVMGVFNPKGQRRRWISMNAIPQFRPEEKKLYRVYTTFGDITERKELERMKDHLMESVVADVVQHKQLQEMKDRFISTVTHELRTPLISIKSYVDYVLSGELGSLPAEVTSSLNVAKRSTDRLLSLVNDLLDIRRLESGRLELRVESLNLREVVDQSVKEIKFFIDEKKQNLHVVLWDESLPVQGDRVRLCQVVVNLLSNASKFTPENGEITLRVEEREDAILIRVSDTGIGIKKEDLERVFQPLASIEKPTYVKGTGLGLSITKSLVEAHGGKIWAESAGEGKGATFTFTVPKRKEVG